MRLRGTGEPIPKISQQLYDDFAELRTARAALDEAILAWAREESATIGEHRLTFKSVAYDRVVTRPTWVSVAQMFDHQTHHRGQVHAMMTALGLDIGPTDIPVMPYAKGL